MDLTDREMVYEMEGKGKEQRGRMNAKSRQSCGTFCSPLDEALLSLTSRESRKVQNDIAPDRHVPFDKSVGSWQRGRLLRTASSPSSFSPSSLRISRPFSLSFSPSVHPRTHFAWLSLYPSTLFPSLRTHRQSRRASIPNRARAHVRPCHDFFLRWIISPLRFERRLVPVNRTQNAIMFQREFL